jgi:hypothetical protein
MVVSASVYANDHLGIVYKECDMYVYLYGIWRFKGFLVGLRTSFQNELVPWVKFYDVEA